VQLQQHTAAARQQQSQCVRLPRQGVQAHKVLVVYQPPWLPATFATMRYQHKQSMSVSSCTQQMQQHSSIQGTDCRSAAVAACISISISKVCQSAAAHTANAATQQQTRYWLYISRRGCLHQHQHKQGKLASSCTHSNLLQQLHTQQVAEST
jgi:hypothetical protein